MKEVSLAAPAYNEQESIAHVVEGWHSYLKSFPELASFEIVVTNDGSRDDTGGILRRLAERYREVRVVDFPQNRGAAVALAAAIAHTSKEWVLLIDSDGQFPVSNLEALSKAVQNASADVAHGVRTRKENSAFTRLGSWASGWAANRIFGTAHRDFNCACKLIRGSLARSLRLEARGLNYSTDVMANLLARDVSIVEVPVRHQTRTGGKSSVRALHDAAHRFLFVMFLGLRQQLIKWQVLDKPRWPA